jgi:hypothetical protein
MNEVTKFLLLAWLLLAWLLLAWLLLAWRPDSGADLT